ncbi:MAG: glycoside hydrolase family 125 protein [Bacillota bacterium]
MTVPRETRETADTRAPIVTGNEWVCLPDIAPDDAGIASVNVLHMASRSLIELLGASREAPLLRPTIAGISLSDLRWDYLADWIPQARGSVSLGCGSRCDVTLTICAPVGERGFMILMELAADRANGGVVDFRPGIEAAFGSVCSTVFSRRALPAGKHVEYSDWTRSIVMEARGSGGGIVALALGASDDIHWRLDGEACRFSAWCSAALAPGETRSVAFWAAVNLEHDGAAVTNVHLRRIGARAALEATLRWLEARAYKSGSIEGEPDAPESASARTVARANRNLHFCRFFAHGRALDTEELVMITSRSPRYYVSAAFWPRDTLLWALPAMLQSDPDFARRVLEATFARHMNNMGVHAHYMDGVLLYPGFELDQLCAYVIALAGYIRHTSDGTILGRDKVEAGLARFEAELERRRHPEAHLYSTFLDPSDDPVKYPYLTYDNVLVWRALADLAHVRAEQGKKESAQRLSALADAVRHTIMENCVVDGPTGPMFAWSVDLAGRYELYDDPPGSLVLLPFYGFISTDHPVYRNTLKFIRSSHNPYSWHGHPFSGVGCAHSPRPWPMHACNAVMAGVAAPEDVKLIARAPLDGGLACETVWETTGAAATGLAFATAAGYLSLALVRVAQEPDLLPDPE